MILDLDGTLVDSVPDLADALNRLMQARGIAAFSASEVTAMVGDGAAALVERAFAARGACQDPAALGDFLADYGAHAALRTRTYPGVKQGLRHLSNAGWLLAVCTNKPLAAALAVLEALGLDGFFASVGGGDSFPVRKPDPAHLLATLSQAGGLPCRALMVGDHHNDVAAAAGAGMKCIFAGWGYGQPAMGRDAAAIARQFSDLPALADALLPPALA